MADPKQVARDIREKIKTATLSNRTDLLQVIEESGLSDATKEKLSDELEVRMNEVEQDEIDRVSASGDKEKAQRLIDRTNSEEKGVRDVRSAGPEQKIKLVLPGNVREVPATEEEMRTFQKAGKLHGWDPKRKIAMVLASFLIFAVLFGAGIAFAGNDTGTLGADQWVVQSDGDIVPATDSAQDLGASGTEIDNVYADDVIATAVTATTVTATNTNVGASIIAEGATADAYETTIAFTDPTADRTITIPDASVNLGALTAANLASNSVVYGAELPAFVVAAGENTACTTTCGAATAICGVDAGTGALVATDSALADTCLCNGATA